MPSPPLTPAEIAAARTDPRLTAALAVPATDTRWHSRSRCRGTDELSWFSDEPEVIAATTQLCAACPVTAECLAFALQLDEPWGVWGGTTARERKAMAVVRGERLDAAGEKPYARCRRGHLRESGDHCGRCLSEAAKLRWQPQPEDAPARSTVGKERAGVT